MLTIENATNPVFSNADNTSIDLMVKFAEYSEMLPFTAMSSEKEEHTNTLFENALKGEYGAIGPYVPPNTDQPTVQGAVSW